MDIVFYGASVTEQSGESGFVPTFNKLIMDNLLNYNIIQKGFGSTHINDCGICKINEIISYNPNICFIDWFSTGLILTNKNELYMYLDTIVRKLMLINCKICFLLLERIDLCENRLIMYKLVVEYSTLYNLEYIELYNNINKSELLRDTVHTTNEGAKIYANKIYKYFIKNIIDKEIIYKNIPEKNDYDDIKILTVNKQINSEIHMNGNFKIIGILQKLGNFSGIIEIHRNDISPYKYNLWDQWCYFTRNNIKLQVPWSTTLKLKILTDTFDSQSCKMNINFNDFEKYMYIYEIYYLGKLIIENII